MLPNVHDPAYWVEELMPLLRELDFAFQLGVPKAHAFFTDFHKKPINKPLLSNLIRYHTLEYLWSHGYSGAKEEDPDGWGFRGLPNNGIELLYKQSCIRVRKGIDPPYPTTSAGEDFYQQKLFEELECGVMTNLLVLYNLDNSLQYDGKFLLLRPTKLNPKRKSVKCDWRRTIEMRTVDLGSCVNPEYSLGHDLPLGAHDGAEETENGVGPDKTGTDGAIRNAD